MGPEGIVLCSATGEGPGDLLALPRAAARMAKARLSTAVVARVCRDNALAHIGVDRRSL
jgi:predicted metal-dependent TIM-barrel fold hydrolase